MVASSGTQPLVGLHFRGRSRVSYFSPAGLDLQVLDWVMAPSEKGPVLGRVVIAPGQVIFGDVQEKLAPLLRKATPEDLALRKVRQRTEIPGR